MPLSNEEITNLVNKIIIESNSDFKADVIYCESYKNKELNSLYIKFIGPRKAEHLLLYEAVMYKIGNRLIEQYGNCFKEIVWISPFQESSSASVITDFNRFSSSTKKYGPGGHIIRLLRAKNEKEAQEMKEEMEMFVAKIDDISVLPECVKQKWVYTENIQVSPKEPIKQELETQSAPLQHPQSSSNVSQQEYSHKEKRSNDYIERDWQSIIETYRNKVNYHEKRIEAFNRDLDIDQKHFQGKSQNSIMSNLHREEKQLEEAKQELKNIIEKAKSKGIKVE
ncbi:MAG: hypothetical protein WA126_02415 [Thermodesulfovibrionales bacterium]